MTSTLDNSKPIYNEDSNQGQFGERHPHSENFRDDKGTENPSSPPVSAGNVVDSLTAKHLELQKEGSNNKARSNATKPYFLNLSADKYHETSSTLPRLVLRVPSSELLPKGWRSIDCILIATYISALFNCVTGSAANRYAWRAKRYRSKGLHRLVRREARRAVFLIYASIALGIFTVIMVVGIYFGESSK